MPTGTTQLIICIVDAVIYIYIYTHTYLSFSHEGHPAQQSSIDCDSARNMLVREQYRYPINVLLLSIASSLCPHC